MRLLMLFVANPDTLSKTNNIFQTKQLTRHIFFNLISSPETLVALNLISMFLLLSLCPHVCWWTISPPRASSAQKSVLRQWRLFRYIFYRNLQFWHKSYYLSIIIDSMTKETISNLQLQIFHTLIIIYQLHMEFIFHNCIYYPEDCNWYSDFL